MTDDRASEPILPPDERPHRRKPRLKVPEVKPDGRPDYLRDYRDQRMNDPEGFGSFEPDVV
jgi:hypothetical protein